jgi:UDP-glucose 4-epimerase
MKKTILVSGVAGFIGSSIADALLLEGHRVIGVDNFSTGKLNNVPDGVDFLEADLSKSQLDRLIPGPVDQIFHLAGQSSGEISFEDPIEDLKKNVHSTLNLIDIGILQGTERILFASSMSVYGHLQSGIGNEEVSPVPISCYGVSKSASENYLQIFSRQIPFVTLRMFNVYGAGQDLANLKQGMVSIYLAQALESGHIVVKGGPERFRDFINIADVVDIWLRAAHSSETLAETINVGTGVKTTVAELIEKIQRELPKTTVSYEGSTPGDQRGIVADTTKLRRLVAKSAFINLDQGVSEFSNWAKGFDGRE